MYGALIRLVAVVVALAAVAGVTYWQGRKAGASAVQSLWDAQRVKDQAEFISALQSARRAQIEIQVQAAQQQRDYQNEIARIDALRADLAQRLRQHPQQRTDSANGVPAGATAGVGCTGAGLSRPDAQFLERLAADAAKTRAALTQCMAAYASVASMSGLNK